MSHEAYGHTRWMRGYGGRVWFPTRPSLRDIAENRALAPPTLTKRPPRPLMQIWFVTAWFGYSDRHPTPLWRHPEVSLLDWLCQLFAPLLLPLKRVVADVRRSGEHSRLVALRVQMDEMDGKSHDKLFADWSASVVEVARADGSTILVHIHLPPATAAGAAAELLPLVVWLHGGGFTLSCARDSVGAKYATELLALGRRVAWASVEYRLVGALRVVSTGGLFCRLHLE